MPTIIPYIRRDVPTNPSLINDWDRARGNWTNFLKATGKRATVLRPPLDTDGISVGQPGAAEVVPGMTNIPLIVYPWPGPMPPITDARYRTRNVYIPNPVRISLPWGTPIQAGDQLAIEPIGQGLPVYQVDGTTTDDSEELDAIASGQEISLLDGT